MTQLARPTPGNRGKHGRSSFVYICVGLVLSIPLLMAIIGGTYFAFSAIFGRPTKPVAVHAARVEGHVQVNLGIVINQPGYQNDWPAYAPNTLVVPANSLVTITIRDGDMGDTPLPQGSPFTTVQGTVGGVAYADGHAYTALAPDKVAHTFTIPQLHINVPLPGDTTTGKPYGIVSFTFRTGAAGSYYFQCFDPCGTGTNGWEGPMITKGYMRGTLTVRA
jgi:hypothetical protein